MKLELRLHLSKVIGLTAFTFFVGSSLLVISGKLFNSNLACMVMLVAGTIAIIAYFVWYPAHNEKLKLTTDARLNQARRLIATKQYGRAHALLKTMPNNPKAQEWLWKLDHMK